MFCNVILNLNKQYAHIKAIIDTGNFLKDPITKTPVIVIEKQALVNLVPKCILHNIDKIINGEEIELGDYISKIRLIPFTSLGRENGILLGIRADSVFIEIEERNIVVENIIIGVYNGILNREGKYSALVGLDLVDRMEGVGASIALHK